MSSEGSTTIRVGHSPDSDDAFMFYALTHDRLDTGGLRFVHQLEDIETLNRRALKGELEVSAVSIHAFAHLADRYALLASGVEHGRSLRSDAGHPRADDARRPAGQDDRRAGQADDGLPDAAALPGQGRAGRRSCRSTRSCPAVAEGRVEAGLLIHEGQLYYGDRGLHKVRRPGPVVVRADRASRCRWAATSSARTWARRWCSRSPRLLKESIRYALEHREEALDYALRYARDLDPALADRFVGMYVNDWTVDYGPRGREAVRTASGPRGGSGFSPGPD